MIFLMKSSKSCLLPNLLRPKLWCLETPNLSHLLLETPLWGHGEAYAVMAKTDKIANTIWILISDLDFFAKKTKH